MTRTDTTTPDERAVQADLGSPRFRAGVDAGKWRLVSLEWPVGVFVVAAAERDNSPSEYALRVDLTGYPQQAPTATPWDLDRGTALSAECRPKGERVGHVFRCDWSNGHALYAPWDRTALHSHTDWATRHSTYAWHPGRDVTFFLTCVHDLLNDDDYLGI